MVVKVFRKNKHGVHKITLDEEGIKLYQKHKWTIIKGVTGNFYMQRGFYINKKHRLILFHRELLNVLDQEVYIDHRDRDGLNNTKDNLRFCTKSQNALNSKPRLGTKSGVRGVAFHAKTKKWRAYITKNQKQIALGLYATIEQAAAVRKKAEVEMYGDFAGDI